MKDTVHISVLPDETIAGLNLKPGMTIVDATLGAGGHSRKILDQIGESGKLIVIDKDKEATDNFSQWCQENSRKNVFIVNRSFSEIKDILQSLNIDSADGILADLGWSSDQIENPARGFSFQKDGPLDMRLSQEASLTAEKIVNNWSENELRKIFQEYGEEKFAGKIAREIVKKRKVKNFQKTLELSELISRVIPKSAWPKRLHPATKIFQALRMAVNDELAELKSFLPEAIDCLAKEGRLAVITFHSLEDRIVKNIFRENARGCICPKEFPICQCQHKATIKIVNLRPIMAKDEELKENPRSRSAKLRIAEKIF